MILPPDQIPEPNRLILKKALTRQLESVTPDNGYRHDLRGRVFRGRLILSRESQDLPLVTINENLPRQSDKITQPDDEAWAFGAYTLMIFGYVSADSDNPTDAADLLFDDVLRALGADKPALVTHQYLGLDFVDKAEVGVRVIHPPGNDESGLPYFVIEWRIGLLERFEGPPGQVEG